MGTIKNKYVKRETYDKLALELRQMKVKKEAADRLFWMLNDNRNKVCLVEIVNDNAAADSAVGLYIHQDGDDAHIEFAGAGGGGIKFAADIASSDSATLDDYEEGYWDANVTLSGSGTYTMATQKEGAYTKVGRVVHCQGEIEVASESSPVGDLRIALPFTSAALTNKAD